MKARRPRKTWGVLTGAGGLTVPITNKLVAQHIMAQDAEIARLRKELASRPIGHRFILPATVAQ